MWRIARIVVPGRRTKTIYAANSTTQPEGPGPGPRVYDYTYHPAGQLASVVKPNGVRIEYAYENRELLATRTYASSQPEGWQQLGADTFRYFPNGLLASAKSGLYNGNVVKRETDPDSQDPPTGIDDFYDAANRPIAEGQNVGAGNKTLNFTYNGDLPDMTTYPGGAQVQQTYTNRRQLYAVNLAAPGEQQLTPQAWHEYDPAGRLTMRHRANNTETLWEYDANSRITHIAHQAAQGGAIFQAWTYAYSDEGNPLAQKDTTPNLAAWGEAYRYDQMNRVIDAKRGPVDANNNVPVLDLLLRQQWDLTKVGNWEQWTKSQQGQQDVIETREHNDLHSLTSRAIDQDPAKNLACDADGNQIDDGEQFLFEYDANDQLQRVRNRANNAIVAEYRYDVFGRRIEKDVKAGNPKGAPVGITRYYYTGQQIAEERDGNDVVQAFYTYGHYIDEPLTMDRWNSDSFTRHFYHQNRMFNTYVLTDSQGAVVERYAYTAYGECTTYDANYANPAAWSRVRNAYTYTGRVYDLESDTMDYRARTYTPRFGRMNQTDPVGVANSVNLYLYAASNPLFDVDSFGHQAVKADVEKERTQKFLASGPYDAATTYLLHFVMRDVPSRMKGWTAKCQNKYGNGWKAVTWKFHLTHLEPRFGRPPRWGNLGVSVKYFKQGPDGNEQAIKNPGARPDPLGRDISEFWTVKAKQKIWTSHFFFRGYWGWFCECDSSDGILSTLEELTEQESGHYTYHSPARQDEYNRAVADIMAEVSRQGKELGASRHEVGVFTPTPAIPVDFSAEWNEWWQDDRP